MNVRRRHGIQKGLKDYMVPLIGVLLIVILIFSVFSGDNEPAQIDLENRLGIDLSEDSASTDMYIEYPGKSGKEKVTGDIDLYKGEKLMVKEGTVALSLPAGGDIKLNRLGELEYLENGNLALSLSEMWLNSTTGINVDLSFANVKVGDNSHISFAQNEVQSTVYLVNGFAEIENLVGKSTVLAAGQMITIQRQDASNEDIDLSLSKENIDDYFKQSDWFILNNGSSYLEKDESEEETSTGTTINISTSGSREINILNLSDGSNVSSDEIVINGNFSNDEITKILINGKTAEINTSLKTFKIEGISVEDSENDIVFKVYDDANDMLDRFVYTVFNDGANASTTSTASKFNVQTFDVDGSQFTFTTIKDGVSSPLNGKTTYTTYGDFLTFYGQVTAQGIASVSVNGYTLNSFNGSTWRYHPSILNNNLSIGTNVYEVKYFNEAGTAVYTNHFTIIKKEAVEEKETSKISSEATIN